MLSKNILDEMSNFVFTSRYAQYKEDLKRRETWEEATDRSFQMHLKKYNKLSLQDKNKIRWAFSLVKDKRVVGSMRAQQFAGKAIEAKNEKIYNCVARHIDSLRSFAEMFFLALNGCGTTFGVLPYFINRIPDLVDASDKTGTVLLYQVEDTIEGWADSLEALLMCYCRNTPLTGRKISFDYSKIRKKGSPLKTTGGKAPGHEGLKAAHTKIKQLLDNIIEVHNQTRLKSTNIGDILCHCMDATLSGGIRRSAAALIFDINDEDMMKYKTGDWIKENPQRARVNISALVLRDKVTFDEFFNIFKKTKEFGEPAFVFANHPWQLLNPCFEINFIPVIDGLCGAQFCNLSSMNGAKIKTIQDWKECVEAATIIGTLQAGYTNFPYLSKTAKQLTEDEALLGVSITGMMDNPELLLNEDYQRMMSSYAVKINKEWASKIGIKQAARITCIKPEGSTSLVFKSGSGIHAHHAHEALRLIQCNKMDPVYKFFKSINPHMCQESVWSANKTDDVILFPLEINKSCIVKDQLTAIKHLEYIKLTQENWVNFGTTPVNKKPITHNVSCTVEVNDNEWDEVAQYLFNNRQNFAAVSLIPKQGDKIYKQAPNQRVETEDDRKVFNELIEKYIPVDYTKLIEEEDNTTRRDQVACSGGQCEL